MGLDSAHDRARARREKLGRQMNQIADAIWQSISSSPAVVVVKSPPGAGKTTTLLRIVQLALQDRKSVGVVTQTNSQADDICRRMSALPDARPIFRFLGSGKSMEHPIVDCEEVHRAEDIPQGPKAVVGVAAKWTLVDKWPDVDIMLVDEAWQMPWLSFVPLLRQCDRFVLIGDPGQIEPVISVPTQRWDTSRHPPHRDAPSVLSSRMRTLSFQLPVTWRLPKETAALVQSFYDFPFDSAAEDGDRCLCFDHPGNPDSAADRALTRLEHHSIAGLMVPMPSSGAPATNDPDVSGACVDVVRRALVRGAHAVTRDREGPARTPLTVDGIGIAVTHKVLMQQIIGDLARAGVAGVKVDTAERWQGLERKLMVVVHPLSSTLDPSFDFDLGTGRLCVMASRHENGMVVVSRNHLAATLEHLMPPARQPLGRPDEASRSLTAHRRFIAVLESALGGATLARPQETRA